MEELVDTITLLRLVPPKRPSSWKRYKIRLAKRFTRAAAILGGYEWVESFSLLHSCSVCGSVKQTYWIDDRRVCSVCYRQ